MEPTEAPRAPTSREPLVILVLYSARQRKYLHNMQSYESRPNENSAAATIHSQIPSPNLMAFNTLMSVERGLQLH